MSRKKIESVLSKIQKLPTLPAVANKITKLMKDPTCTAIKIAEVMDKDQSLTTRVLRLVNSAYYSLYTEVTNVRHAVALLGFRTISQIIISISVFDVFKGRYGEDFDREGFWKHSIGCAVISQMIAKMTKYPKVDDCFTAGLLHDAGKVVLDQFLHEEMTKVIALIKEKNICFADAEKEVLGLNHAEIGGQVMKNWNIPVTIMVAVQHHHQQVEERKGTAFSQDLIVDIIRLADVLCKREGIGYSGDTIVPELKEELWERLNLDQESIVTVIEHSGEEIEKAEVLLELT